MALTADRSQHASSPAPSPARTRATVLMIVTPPRPAAPHLAPPAPQPADGLPGLSPAEREAVTWHDAEWQ
jgi:hypothetical protein